MCFCECTFETKVEAEWREYFVGVYVNVVKYVCCADDSPNQWAIYGGRSSVAVSGTVV